MKRAVIPSLALVLALCPVAIAGGRHDVNRDGRFDRSDVQALARMVAGLDPIDRGCDQDGDGLLTVADVRALAKALDAANAAAPPPTSSQIHAPASSAGTGTMQYLLVEQAQDGKIVVAVGSAGVRPGDRILGIFDSLAKAEAARQRLAAGERPPAPPRAVPPPPAPTPAPTASPDAEAAPAVPELRGVVAAVPLGPGRTLLISPGGRDGWLLGSIGDGSHANLVHQDLEPLDRFEGRFGTVAPVFHVPRRADALFLFLPGVGEGRLLRGLWHKHMTSLNVTFTRTIRSGAGPHAVLPIARQSNTGRTSGLYLYHWPSGTTLYTSSLAVAGLGSQPRNVPGLPATAHEPVVVPVESRGGATRSFVLIEPADGTMWLVLNVRPHPYAPRTVTAPINLARLRNPGGTTPSLVAVPLYGPGGATNSALVADGISGRMALLTGDDNPVELRLHPLDNTVNGALPPGPDRRLMALSLDRSGGALLLDASSGRLVRVTPSEDGTALIRPVTVLR